MNSIPIKYRLPVFIIFCALLGAVVFLNFEISKGRGIFALAGLPYPVYMIYAFFWDKNMFWLGSIQANNENTWLRLLVLFCVFIYIFGIGLSTYNALILKRKSIAINKILPASLSAQMVQRDVDLTFQATTDNAALQMYISTSRLNPLINPRLITLSTLYFQ